MPCPVRETRLLHSLVQGCRPRGPHPTVRRMAVAVVTDSTADLPADLVTEHGVRVVPLRIAIDAQTAVDGVDIGPDEVVEALQAKRTVSTSRPSPGDFVRAYRQALDAGADHVV